MSCSWMAWFWRPGDTIISSADNKLAADNKPSADKDELQIPAAGLSAVELKRVDVLWASALGIGFLRPAPGTWGSVAAALVWWLTPLSTQSAAVQLLVCVVYFLSGWWVSARICRRYQVADASQIVADEVVGMWLALALLPVQHQQWWWVLLALLLFRWLDIAKPSLIGWLDREVKGGLGVMADDVLAGLLAGLVTLAVVMGFAYF